MNLVFWLLSAAAPALLLSFPTAQALSPSVSSFLCTKWGWQNAPGGSQNQHRFDTKHELQVTSKVSRWYLTGKLGISESRSSVCAEWATFPLGFHSIFPRDSHPPGLCPAQRGCLCYGCPGPFPAHLHNGRDDTCDVVAAFHLDESGGGQGGQGGLCSQAWAGTHQRGSLRSRGQWSAGPIGQVRKDCWQGGDHTGPGNSKKAGTGE